MISNQTIFCGNQANYWALVELFANNNFKNKQIEHKDRTCVFLICWKDLF